MWLFYVLIGCVSVPTAQVQVREHVLTALDTEISITLSHPAPLQLVCTSDDDDMHVRRIEDSVDVRLLGLLAETAYHCTLTHVRGVVVWQGTIETGPLPPDLVDLVAKGDPSKSELAGGFVLLNHWRMGNAFPRIQRVVIVDGRGRIRWYLPVPDATTGGVAATWTGTHVLIGGGNGAAPALYDLEGGMDFEVGPPPADPDFGGYHHEALWTEEGWVVSLADAPFTTQTDTTYAGFRIEATDPATGEVRWSFDAADAVDAGDFDWVPLNSADPLHVNALLWVTDDEGPAVWVSSRATHTIFRIDRETHEITWRMGRENGDFTFVDPHGALLGVEAAFLAQHGPHLEGDLLFLLDNGAPRPDGLYTQARVYRIDQARRKVTPLWSWTEPDWFEPYYGNVDPMPGGGALVASGHCPSCDHSGRAQRQGFVAEIDSQGTEEYRLRFDDWSHSLYRAEFVDGCALFDNATTCPALRDELYGHSTP